MSAICVKRLRAEEKQVYVLKHGEIGIQIDEEKAEYICRTLALFLGLDIVEQRKNIRVLTQKANKESTIEKPLGV